MFDRQGLVDAFALLGADLVRRGLFVEIAVYGGSALMMQFAWRRGTEDVDAVVRPGHDPDALKPSVASVAKELGLAEDWLNDAVGMFTPLDEPDDLFAVSGTYPPVGTPGLRVLVAGPAYLLGMKLLALRSVDRGDRDLKDARALAAELAMTDAASLSTLYASIHGERPTDDLIRQFALVVG